MSNFNVQLLKSMKRKKLKFSVDEFCDFVQVCGCLVVAEQFSILFVVGCSDFFCVSSVLAAKRAHSHSGGAT